METFRIQFAVVIVNSQLIYQPGQLVIRHGRILSAGNDCSEKPDWEFPSSIASAGLVNPHTHLEFSNLHFPFPPGPTFPDWIGRVVAHRRIEAQNRSEEELCQIRNEAIHTGIIESLEAGVAVLGDIVTQPWNPDYLDGFGKELDAAEQAWRLKPALQRNERLKPALQRNEACMEHLSCEPYIFPMLEILGLDPKRLSESIVWSLSTQGHKNRNLHTVNFGLSPHSPYSLDFELVQQFLNSSQAKSRLTAVHLAESLEERQWLDCGTGPFRDAFEKIGVPTTAPRWTIANIIDWLSTRRRSLLVHGNYLSDNEIASIAPSTSVVYCPRTHQHFGHSEYPLGKLMAGGINVVLGTDSRASNPDLDLWEEVRFVRQQFAWVDPCKLFAMVTELAANSLGLDNEFGSLLPGRRAVINLSDFDSSVRVVDILAELTLRSRPFKNT